MLNRTDFENIIWDFLFTYRQFLLNRNLHKKVHTGAYEKNVTIWDTILLGLEAGAIVGLARLLERKNDIGRNFNDKNLNSIASKILDLRNAYIAHFDLSNMRNSKSFLEKNHLTQSDLELIIDAIKNKLINYQKKFNFGLGFEILFETTKSLLLEDLDNWLGQIMDKPKVPKNP